MLSIVSNSPGFSPASATCARPASPTCSLPCWEISREISRAIRPARHGVMMKERLNEYSIERHARVSVRIAGSRARGHLGDSAHVLVGATRIVGEPFHLH